MITLKHIIITILILFPIQYGVTQSIEGKLWFDGDLNGMIDGGEQGISNIPIFLLRCNGQFVGSTVTNATGDYAFSNLNPDNYKIYVNKAFLPNVYKPTIYSTTTDNKIQLNSYSLCEMISDDETLVINAGFGILSTIGDYVWEDTNYNGVQDNNESGIHGVVVSAYKDGVLIKQATTNSSGEFYMTGMYPGSYSFKYTMDATYIPTKYQVGNANLNSDVSRIDEEIWSSTFSVTGGTNVYNIDAGFYRCAEFCGQIYNDANLNNLFDGNENGINGVTVQIWNIDGQDTIFAGSVETGLKPGFPSEDGYYRFCVAPGTYFLKVIMPSSEWLAGSPFVGNNPNKYNYITHQNGINTTNTFTVTSGDSHCNINNGFYCSATIYSYVWIDSNFDGYMGSNEARVSNCDVRLCDASTNAVLNLTYTNSNGLFVFDSITPGNYYLRFPNSLDFTVPIVSGNFYNVNDSKVDGAFGYATTPSYSFSLCQEVNYLSAGVVSGLLPVTWLSIEIFGRDGQNTLSWELSEEKNVQKYTILASSEGISWDEVGEVVSSNTKKYNFILDLDNRYTFFKVVAIDFDGKMNTSPIVNLSHRKDGTNTIFPNPTNDLIQINMGEKDGLPVHLQLFDVNGRLVLDKYVMDQSSVSLKEHNFEYGLYFLQLKTENNISYHKILFSQD
ncbi:MAG: T9SS type A sorting domain-containing protein [Lewinellaceae bacterium]|nr:T9SS type A sorting domain-containing protein [Lewinellaceae bacterium]